MKYKKRKLILVITGSPGVGKTTLAKYLSKILNCKVINEREFALENKLGKWNDEIKEVEIDIKKMEKKLNEKIKKENRLIIEGHTLCEAKINADVVILITLHPEILEYRLEARGYNYEKIMDNVFCEGIEYCKKHTFRNYPKDKIIEIESQRSFKNTKELVIIRLKEKGLI
ncbi:MAG: AAA family ATPase [Candidatus Diapherotrites archaeon]|nr:AAA family ATPase [Candidatus Diapherotrites archaeon]